MAGARWRGASPNLPLSDATTGAAAGRPGTRVGLVRALIAGGDLEGAEQAL